MSLGQKIFVVIGFSFILYAIIYLNYLSFTGGVAKVHPIGISQDTANRGAFFPYVTYDKINGEDRAIMVYSSIGNNDPRAGNEANPLVNVKIATSSNDGESWTSYSTVFKSRADQIEGFQGINNRIERGIWRYEQPSIIYDPDDPGREYKVFALRYFWNGDISVARQYSTIVYIDSPQAVTLWPTNKEVWLFSSSSAQPPSPYNSLVKLKLDRLSPALRDVTGYSDPSAFYKDKVIFLLLTAYTDNPRKGNRLVMIASTDHGRSWIYLGSPISAADMAEIGGYDQVSGGSLVEQDGKILLMATYGFDAVTGLGTRVFEVADLAKATLRRDAKGVPVVLNVIPGIESIMTPPGTARATWHENIETGILMPQVTPNNFTDRIYSIFATRKTPLPD